MSRNRKGGERIVKCRGIRMKMKFRSKFMKWYKSVSQNRHTEKKKDDFFRKNRIMVWKKKDVKARISNYAKSPFPFVTPPKDVRLAANGQDVKKWIKKFVSDGKCDHVGIDTEFDAVKVFYYGESFTQSFMPDVVQIATEQKILLIQTSEGLKRPPLYLIELLKNKNIRKSFCNVYSDYTKLKNWFNFHQIDDLDVKEPSTKEETLLNRVFEKFNFFEIDPYRKGLSRLCEQYLSEQMKKNPNISLSRWSKKRLSFHQQEYASDDPYVTLILSKNEDRERRENRLKFFYESRKKYLEEFYDNLWKIVSLAVWKDEDYDEEEDEGEEENSTLPRSWWTKKRHIFMIFVGQSKTKVQNTHMFTKCMICL